MSSNRKQLINIKQTKNKLAEFPEMVLYVTEVCFEIWMFFILVARHVYLAEVG